MNFGNGALFVGTLDQESLLAGGEIGRACFPARLAWKRHRGRTDLAVGPARIAGGAASLALDSTRGENVSEASWQSETGGVRAIGTRGSTGGAASWWLAARAALFYRQIPHKRCVSLTHARSTPQRHSNQAQSMKTKWTSQSSGRAWQHS